MGTVLRDPLPYATFSLRSLEGSHMTVSTVIQQIFQVGAVRVGVVGVRNQFVVLDDLGFDQQDRVMQVDVIVPGSRDGKRHRDLVTVDGTEGFVLDSMSRFDVDLGGGNGNQVQFGFHAFARLSVDQSHCEKFI